MLNKKQISKITNRLMLSLKRGGYLKKLKPLEEETLEEDIYELIEIWKKHLTVSYSLYKSFYSGNSVPKSELLQVDKIIGRMSSKDREFLMDKFPKSKNPRKAPFIHKSDLGYNVLNISKSDLKKARKKY